MSTPPLHPPLPNLTCPLCGSANECAAALSGDFNTPCWCRQATFPAELLGSIPEASKGKSCICRRCVEAANAAHPKPLHQAG